MQTFYSNDERNKVVITNILLVLLVFFSISSFIKKSGNLKTDENEITDESIVIEADDTNLDNKNGVLRTTSEKLDTYGIGKTISFVDIDVKDAYKQDIYVPSGKGYRYGPSIIRNNDGSVDIWLSSPGNNSTEWDYIRYIHSEDNINWTKEEIVLKPTKNSKDHFSVCDPGVIFFNDYYYIGYTSTENENGTDNSIFVARSKNPNGPFEKWNGESWGGNPEPIIKYDGDQNYYGAGEITFVIKDNTLHMYYSNYVDGVCCLNHAIADLDENWPNTIRDIKTIMKPRGSDSVDAVYVEDMDLFLLFSIQYDNRSDSRLMVLESIDGENFVETTYNEYEIEPYAHSLGVEKDKSGHIKTGDLIFIGYAYGDDWAEWSTKLQSIRVNNTFKKYLTTLNTGD